MIIKKQGKTENFSLIKKIGNEYHIGWGMEEITEDEKKFKNSAFVKTGRKIPTGQCRWNASVIFKKNSKPTLNEIKSSIFNDIDYITKNKILSGLKWNGYEVWLNSENQKNYADWYTLTKDNEDVLPLTAKFTKSGKTILYEFSTHQEIASLYSAIVKHINDVVNKGRLMKENVNFEDIKEALKEI